jgi:hypothetical protein
MHVPDPASEEWIDQSISTLTGVALDDVVATLRARGGRQAGRIQAVVATLDREELRWAGQEGGRRR